MARLTSDLSVLPQMLTGSFAKKVGHHSRVIEGAANRYSSLMAIAPLLHKRRF